MSERGGVLFFGELFVFKNTKNYKLLNVLLSFFSLPLLPSKNFGKLLSLAFAGSLFISYKSTSMVKIPNFERTLQGCAPVLSLSQG